MGKVGKLSNNRKDLVAKLDKAFSIFIRQRGATDGTNVCFTCGTRKPIAELHAGHFMSRGKYATRWDERNVQPQCVACNLYNNGQQFLFGQNLDKRFGIGTAQDIYIRSQRIGGHTKDDLQSMIDDYSARNKFG